MSADLLDPPSPPGPVQWVEKRLGEVLWSKQREILQAVEDHTRVAVHTCHDIGKSHVASRVVGWFLDCHPVGEAFVVTTAPTGAQVRAILWRYIRQMHTKASLKGRVNQTEWHLADQLVAFGRKPADYNESAFQGIHARRVLVVIDEACGVDESIWNAAEALATNADCRILAIGNPDNPASHFKTMCDSQLWHTIHVSAFDSPNFTGEKIPAELGRHLISKEWAEARKVAWGEDSPLYISKVLGRFPSDNPNSLLSLGDLTACRAERDQSAADGAIILGVDVAGSDEETDGDMSVIRERRGMVAARQWTKRSSDPEVIAAWIMDRIIETNCATVRIDSTGLGWGVVGLVRKMVRDANRDHIFIQGVNASQASSEPSRFANSRAQMWWHAREASKARSLSLHGAQDTDTLIAELCQPNWSLDTKGRIVVEKKKEIRKRLGRSPDHADAFLLAFYDRYAPVDEAGDGQGLISLSGIRVGEGALFAPAPAEESEENPFLPLLGGLRINR